MAGRKQAAWHLEGAANRQDAEGPAGPETVNLPQARRSSNPIAAGSRLRSDNPQAARCPCFTPSVSVSSVPPILVLKKSYRMPMREKTALILVSVLGMNR